MTGAAALSNVAYAVPAVACADPEHPAPTWETIEAFVADAPRH
jgi:hypothetical protein